MTLPSPTNAELYQMIRELWDRIRELEDAIARARGSEC